MSNSNTRRRKAKKRAIWKTELLRMWSKIQLNSVFPRTSSRVTVIYNGARGPGKSWLRKTYEEALRKTQSE